MSSLTDPSDLLRKIAEAKQVLASVIFEANSIHRLDLARDTENYLSCLIDAESTLLTISNPINLEPPNELS